MIYICIIIYYHIIKLCEIMSQIYECSHDRYDCKCILVVVKTHQIPCDCPNHSPVEDKIVFLKPPTKDTLLRKPVKGVMLTPGTQLLFCHITNYSDYDEEQLGCCYSTPTSTLIRGLMVQPDDGPVVHGDIKVMSHQEALNLRCDWALSKKHRVSYESEIRQSLYKNVASPLITIIVSYAIATR